MRATHFGLLFVCAAGALAQSVETIPFRAVMSTANEVPAITDLTASAAATIWVHVVRDASGNIASGSVDFNVSYSFPGEVTFTGLHIHPGAAGVNGPVVISSGLSGTNPLSDSTGRGSVSRQGQVAATDTNGLAALKGLLQDPSQYYVNMHTPSNPAGVIRGQLQRARMAVLMGLMSPANEVPAINSDVRAVGSVIALQTSDSGQVIFDVNYSNFPEGTTFTGLHIHNGPAGVNAPVTISSGIGGSNTPTAAAGGSGNLHYEVEVAMNNAAAVETLNNLFDNPAAAYINVHTTVFPGGIARAQLRPTDRMPFQVVMSTANEVPPITGLDASAPAQVVVHTIRNEGGEVAAGTVIFDVNYRFPGDATFTGLHVHDGVAGQNGPVTISSGLSGTASVPAAAGGAGNIWRAVNVSGGAGLATLNSLIRNPENHYVNLHTTVNPGGVVRSQLSPAITAKPAIDNVIAAVSDGALKTVAPGGLMTIFGRNLTKVPGDLTAWQGSTAPSIFNGTSVTIGGEAAPLVMVTPGYIVAQVPVDAATGTLPVLVTDTNGTSSSFNTTVASAAPAIYFDSLGGIAFHNSDFSLVRPNNPAVPGEYLVLYATGLGASPSLATGQAGSAGSPFNSKNGVTATINGQILDVIYAIAAPGMIGIDQVAVQVPTGLPSGGAILVIRVGGVNSNAVMIPVR